MLWGGFQTKQAKDLSAWIKEKFAGKPIPALLPSEIYFPGNGGDTFRYRKGADYDQAMGADLRQFPIVAAAVWLLYAKGDMTPVTYQYGVNFIVKPLPRNDMRDIEKITALADFIRSEFIGVMTLYFSPRKIILPRHGVSNVFKWVNSRFDNKTQEDLRFIGRAFAHLIMRGDIQISVGINDCDDAQIYPYFRPDHEKYPSLDMGDRCLFSQAFIETLHDEVESKRKDDSFSYEDMLGFMAVDDNMSKHICSCPDCLNYRRVFRVALPVPF